MTIPPWTPAGPDYSTKVRLSALTQSPRSAAGASLCLQIPQADGSSFTVEARRKAQWDRSIPVDNVVVINQVRTNDLSYLVPHGGAYFTSSQTFTTTNPEVTVSIGSWQGDQVETWVWDLPDGALRQEAGDARVYLIQAGTKRWVQNPSTLQAIQAATGRVVREVAAGGLTGIPTGSPIAILNLAVIPYPVPINRSVQVTVNASDPVSQAAVSGDVMIGGRKVGVTGTPFTYVFRCRRVGRPPDFELVCPKGMVIAASYWDSPIDFGWLDTLSLPRSPGKILKRVVDEPEEAARSRAVMSTERAPGTAKTVIPSHR